MQTTIHKAETRGYANHGWLDTHHTFSFANYFNPDRVHFGNLRVLNDDVIAPGSGFDKHPHDNMEIVSIPISGSLLHMDSMGHKQVIGENEVQVMSAGSGIFHSEYNASGTDEANFLQLWFLPKLKNITPTYDQLKFDEKEAINQWQVLVDDEKGPLKLNQEVSISRVFLSQNNSIVYCHKNTNRKSYLFVIEGIIELNEKIFGKRDGIGIDQISHFEINALKTSYLINIEV